jgi:hypothetical protein
LLEPGKGWLLPPDNEKYTALHSRVKAHTCKHLWERLSIDSLILDKIMR